MANLGSDFGVIGNTEVTSTNKGRTYGAEFLAQQKLSKGFYGLVAVTLFRSEFQDINLKYTPSSWDSKLIISATAGKKFGKNWELGAKWRFTGGTPFTPIDSATSSLIAVWNTNGIGLPNYKLLNSQRLGVFHQLDMRLDKKWYLKKLNIDLYADVQNVYAFKYKSVSYLDVVRDTNGNPIISSVNPLSYQTQFIENLNGTVLPTIGLVIEM